MVERLAEQHQAPVPHAKADAERPQLRAAAAEPDDAATVGPVSRELVELRRQRAYLGQRAADLAEREEEAERREKTLLARERELEARTPDLVELEQKQAELARAETALEERERQLVFRSRALAAQLRELELAGADGVESVGAVPDASDGRVELRAAAGELAKLARSVAERLEALMREQTRLETVRRELGRHGSLERRAAELARREHELARRYAELESRPVDRQAASEAQAELRLASGVWNLAGLEKLVEARANEFPERVDEWRAYLLYLREFASTDGGLTPALDGLVAEEFAALIEASTGQRP